ncbi:cytochrome c (plasmid) [Verrucomicrobiaceae bacterium 227]
MKSSPTGNEPGEKMDVRRRHGQIWREYSEPREQYHRMPWWLKHGIYAPLFIWAAWYLIIYTGDFDTNEYYEGLDPINYSPVAKENDGKSDLQTSSVDGEKIYTQSCLACHQANGQGIPGAFPPLAGSDWVSGNPDRLSALVLHGLMGPIKVNGVDFNGAMPPWGITLDDASIAAALTYVRSSWGNDSPPVEAAGVAKIRGEYEGHAPWQLEELETAFPGK